MCVYPPPPPVFAKVLAVEGLRAVRFKSVRTPRKVEGVVFPQQKSPKP